MTQPLTKPKLQAKILNNEKMVSFRRGSGFYLVSIHGYAQKNSRNNFNSFNNRNLFSNWIFSKVNKFKKYDRTKKELEEFLLFSILISGKVTNKSEIILEKTKVFLQNECHDEDVLNWIHKIASIKSNHSRDYIFEFLKEYDLPRNKKVLSCIRDFGKIKNDLKNITKDELKSIDGIGESISTFFIKNTRKSK